MNIATEIIINYGIHYLANNALQLFNRTCVTFCNYATQKRATRSISFNMIKSEVKTKGIPDYGIVSNENTFSELKIWIENCDFKIPETRYALECYKKLLILSKTSEERLYALEMQYQMYCILQQVDSKIECTKLMLAIVETPEEKYKILNRLGYLMCKKNPTEAIVYFKQSLELAKTSEDRIIALNFLIKAYIKQNNFQNVFFLYKEILKLNPSNEIMDNINLILKRHLKVTLYEEPGK